MPRTSPKAWRSKSSKSRAASRSYPTRYRKRPTWSRKSAITATGIHSSVSRAPFKHRFTRWSQTMDVVTYNNAGLANVKVVGDGGGGLTQPLSVGGWTADSSGAPNAYQFGGAMQFLLSDVPAFSDFGNLFDAYKIDQVDIEISCLMNSATVGDPAHTMPTVMYCPDFDDANIPAGPSDLSEKQRMKQWTFRGTGNPLKFSIKPRVAQPVYRPGVTAAYAIGEPQYLNMTYYDVPHYGLKLWFQDCYSTNAPTYVGDSHFRVKVKYNFSFRDPQ